MKIVLSILCLSFTLFGSEKKEDQDQSVHDGKPTYETRRIGPGPKHPAVIAAHAAANQNNKEETRRCGFCTKQKNRPT